MNNIYPSFKKYKCAYRSLNEMLINEELQKEKQQLNILYLNY